MKKLVLVVTGLMFLCTLAASSAGCGKVTRIYVQAPPDTVVVDKHKCPHDD